MQIFFTGAWDLEFAGIVEKALAEFMPKLSHYYNFPDKLTVKLSTSLSICAGKAKLKKDTIDLNYRLLKNNPAEIRDTFGHELAHLVEYWTYKTVGHGIPWKNIMLRLELPPKRTHDLDVSAFRPKFTYSCACAPEIIVSKRKHNAIQRGTNYRCRDCGIRIYLKNS